MDQDVFKESWGMTEQERQEIKRHPLSIFNVRPQWARPDDWKNRNRISAKLIPINYTSAFIYFKKMGMSWSSGLNHLIENKPEIQQIQKDLQNND